MARTLLAERRPEPHRVLSGSGPEPVSQAGERSEKRRPRVMRFARLMKLEVIFFKKNPEKFTIGGPPVACRLKFGQAFGADGDEGNAPPAGPLAHFGDKAQAVQERHLDAREGNGRVPQAR